VNPSAGGDPDGPFPLGLMQHAYWIGRDDPHRLGGVAAHLYTEFDGPQADPERLTAAVLGLAARHDMLRVRLTDNGEQVVGDTPSWSGLTVHDLRDAAPGHAAAELERIRQRLSHQKLAIEAGEVFTVEVSLLPGGRGRLHLDVDMVAADAASYRLLVAELARRYSDPQLTLPPIGYNYRRYRAERPTGHDDDALWWRDRLPDLPEGPDLPLTPTPGPVPQVRRRHLHLDSERLTGAAKRRGLTPAAVLATVFAEVVGAFSEQRRFLLNVPMFDRAPLHPEVSEVVGDFSGSVMLAVDLTGPATFAERAAAIQARLHTDMGHAGHSGLDVLRDLSRRYGRRVLAPVVFTSALSLGELFGDIVRDTFGEPVWIISQGPQVLLDAQVTELSGGILVNWDCREEQFADGVLDAMFALFARLVEDLVADGPAWDEPVAADAPGPITVTARVVDERGSDRPLHVAGRLLLDGHDTGQRARRTPGGVELLAGTAEAPAPAQPVSRPPATDLERAIALVFAEHLPAAEIGADDDFLALGGDSVLASSIVARLREGLDSTAVSVRALLETPTVAGLAAALIAVDPQLEDVATVFLEIEDLSDDEVRAELEREDT
jgi:mycobactin phenyloxazoline synthetase